MQINLQPNDLTRRKLASHIRPSLPQLGLPRLWLSNMGRLSLVKGTRKNKG